jgi:hypothetical protein
MAQLFTAILAKITAFAVWVLELIGSVFVDLWEMVVDTFCYLADTVLTFAVDSANQLDISAISQYTGVWDLLPDGTRDVLGAIGLVPALAIVFAAILIRMTLQLIPFDRL